MDASPDDPPPPIFISHARADLELAQAICDALERRGWTCWMAVRDVRPGQNFGDAIASAMRRARVMVLIFSEHANNSEEIKKEVVLAGRGRLTLIPLRAEEIEPSGAFEYELRTRQWIDLFTNWDKAVDRLMREVRQIIGPPPDQPQPLTDPAPAPQPPPIPAPAPAPVPPPVAPPKPPRRRAAIISALAVLACVIGGTILAVSTTKRPAVVASVAPQPSPSTPTPPTPKPTPPHVSPLDCCTAWEPLHRPPENLHFTPITHRPIPAPINQPPAPAKPETASLHPAPQSPATATPAPTQPTAPSVPSQPPTAQAPPATPMQTPAQPANESATYQPSTPQAQSASPQTTPSPQPFASRDVLLEIEAIEAFQRKDYAESFALSSQAANAGNAAAQNQLGDDYYFGYGVEHNYKLAESWYQKSAAQGNVEAEVSLGDLYVSGMAGVWRYTDAIVLYKQAIAQGRYDAAFTIGEIYQYGWGVKPDITQARYWYSLGAQHGDVTAQYWLKKHPQ